MTAIKGDIRFSIGRIACLIFLTAVFLMAACAVPMVSTGKVPGLFMNGAIVADVFLATAAIVIGLDGNTLADAGLRFRPVDIAHLAGGVLAVFVAFAAITAALCALDGVNYFPQFAGALLHPGRTPLNFFVIPFAEEVFYRGYMQSNTFRTLSWNRRSVLTALLFSAPHWLDTAFSSPLLYVVSRVIATFLFGLVFNELRRRTGSIWMGFGAHWANNFIFTNLFADNRFYVPATYLVFAILCLAVPVLLAKPLRRLFAGSL